MQQHPSADHAVQIFDLWDTHECTETPEQVNVKALEDWIAGQGKHPVSWDTLIEVLQDIDLGALASDIAAIKCSCNERLLM